MNKLERFREGLKNLTQLQQLNARAMGSLWGAIGLSIAIVGMVYNLTRNFTLIQLGFSIFVAFLIYTQIVQYIGTKQQIAIIKEAEEKVKEMEILNAL